MTAIIIYTGFVFVFMFADAVLCIVTKNKFNYWEAFCTHLMFPATLPVILIYVHKRTKEFPESKNLIDVLEEIINED